MLAVDHGDCQRFIDFPDPEVRFWGTIVKVENSEIGARKGRNHALCDDGEDRDSGGDAANQPRFSVSVDKSLLMSAERFKAVG